jgi:hypothetical protein
MPLFRLFPHRLSAYWLSSPSLALLLLLLGAASLQAAADPLTFMNDLKASSVESTMNLEMTLNFGLADTGSTWLRVNFPAMYPQTPVIVATMMTNAETDPAWARIRNAGRSGFEIRAEEGTSQNGTHASETFSWIAMAQGVYNAAGKKIEARITPVTSVDLVIAFTSAFSTIPVVLTSLISLNETDPAVTEVYNVTTTGFTVHIEEQPNANGVHGLENMAWIAMETGSFVLNNGVIGQVGRLTTTNQTTGFDTATFSPAFSYYNRYPIIVGDINGNVGTDPKHLRLSTPTAANFRFRIEESSPYNNYHESNPFVWMALGGGGKNVKAQWTFNECYGPVIYDQSIFKNNGSKMNLIKRVLSTISDQYENYREAGCAMKFNGLGNYITVPDSTSLNISDLLSVEFWLRVLPPDGQTVPDDQLPNATIIDRGLTTVDNKGWNFEYDNSGKFICFKVGNGSAITSVCTPTNLNDAHWHHVFGVMDGKNVKIYVDGQLHQATPWPGGSIGTHTRPTLIGDANCCPGRYFKGELDEMVVYNYAFDDYLVKSAYESWSYGLVGRYDFDQFSGTGPGSTVYDQSMLSNHASLVDSSLTSSDLDIQEKGADTGYALDCNGSGYMRIPDSPTLHTSYVSIAAWIKPNQTVSSSVGIIGKYNEWKLLLDSGNVLKAAIQPNYSNVQGTAVIPPDVWSHVAATWNGRHVRIYANGLLKNELDLSDGWNTPTNNDITVGTLLDGSGAPQGFFPGKIEGVSIWNNSRGESEIFDRAMYIAKSGWPIAKVKSPYNEETIAVNLEVNFSAETSSDPAGTNQQIVNYYWDFGDGTPLVQTTANEYKHRYTSTGFYTIFMSVQDGDYNFDGTYLTVEIISSMALSDLKDNAIIKAQNKALERTEKNSSEPRR